MKTRLALWVLALLLAAACVILALPGYSYSAQDREAPMADASIRHPAGTDPLGRDRMVRVSAALLLGLGAAMAAAAITTGIAAAVGTLAAFSPPVISAVLLFVSDLFLTLPWLFLLMIVRSSLPLTLAPLHSVLVTFAILAALGWCACARAVYQGARGLRGSEWIVQARAAGLRTDRLLGRHLLPQLKPLLVPQFLLCVPAFLVAEANLGALGLGVAEPLPSWGAMLLELGNSALLARSRWVYLPIALLVLVLLLLEAIASGSRGGARA